jgi:hypothetical protein
MERSFCSCTGKHNTSYKLCLDQKVPLFLPHSVVNSENNTSSGRACFSEQLKRLFQPILQSRQEDPRVLVVDMA